MTCKDDFLRSIPASVLRLEVVRGGGGGFDAQCIKFLLSLSLNNAVFSDRPLPPRNIVVSDIKADSCYLTWDAPEDNGGSEITNYIVERRDASKKKSDFDVLTIHLIDRRYGVRQKPPSEAERCSLKRIRKFPGKHRFC